MIYWTELWVAVLTAGLVYALWHQRRLARELRKRIGEHHHRMNMLGLSLGGKKDKRPFTPKPRARRVDTVFHDRDDEGREHWLCVNCGASVPQMGHTVKACEEERAIVELEDRKENLLRHRAALLKAAKAIVRECDIENGRNPDWPRPWSTATEQVLFDAIKQAEGDDEEPEYAGKDGAA